MRNLGHKKKLRGDSRKKTSLEKGARHLGGNVEANWGEKKQEHLEKKKNP